MNKILFEVAAQLRNPHFVKENLHLLIVNNLPPTAYAVYDCVKGQSDVALSDVVSCVDMNQTHAANILAELVQLGLIERKKVGVYRYRVVQ